MNQVSQKGDAAARNENGRLSDSGNTEHRERQRHCANTLPRALDALVDKAVRMVVMMPVLILRIVRVDKAMRMVVRMVVMMPVLILRIVRVVVSMMNRRREAKSAMDMAMGSHMRMRMHQTTVAMFQKIGHLPPNPSLGYCGGLQNANFTLDRSNSARLWLSSGVIDWYEG
ncbi:MAG TPA: hypothetical protein VIJ50_04300 [Solirubrobacteraceae bacterium]